MDGSLRIRRHLERKRTRPRLRIDTRSNRANSFLAVLQCSDVIRLCKSPQGGVAHENLPVNPHDVKRPKSGALMAWISSFVRSKVLSKPAESALDCSRIAEPRLSW